MDVTRVGIPTPMGKTNENKSRRMLSVAGTLLILALLLFLWQLVNLGTFNAKASGLDILPISIRANLAS